MPIRVIPIRAKGSKSPGLRLKPRWGSISRPIANGVFSQPFDLQPSGVRWYGRFRSNYGVGYFSDGQRFAHSTRPRFDAAGSMDTSIADFAALIGAFMQSRLIRPGGAARTVLTAGADPGGPSIPALVRATRPGTCRGRFLSRPGCRSLDRQAEPGCFRGGHDKGFDNMFVCLVDEDRCVLLMSNAPHGQRLFPQIVDELIGPTDLPWQC